MVIAEHLKKGFGENLLIDDLDFRLPQRRHRRRHRPERRRQDDAVPHDRRPGEARRRRAQGRRDGEAGLRRSVARGDRARQERVAADLARRRVPRVRQAEDQLARLHVVVRLPRLRSAEARQGAVGRRAQPPAPGDDAQDRRQPPAARRADQRSRRRHAARARRGALSVRRLRRRHQPRSLVPRSRRHAHPRLRGRRQGRLVRGQLSRPTRPTRSAASAPTPISRTASSTRSSRTSRGGRHVRPLVVVIAQLDAAPAPVQKASSEADVGRASSRTRRSCRPRTPRRSTCRRSIRSASFGHKTWLHRRRRRQGVLGRVRREHQHAGRALRAVLRRGGRGRDGAGERPRHGIRRSWFRTACRPRRQPTHAERPRRSSARYGQVSPQTDFTSPTQMLSHAVRQQ